MLRTPLEALFFLGSTNLETALFSSRAVSSGVGEADGQAIPC